MDSQIRTIHEQLKSGQITCKALIKSKLDLLGCNTHNTVNYLLAEQALEMAEKVDAKISLGEEIGLLEGIPFGIKDVFMQKGVKSTASSNMLSNYNSPYNATAIDKLINAGAIPVVRENCDSFGHGSTSENTIFGPVLNAVDTSLSAGGSSGGSAVNVALGNTVFSIGGDTGGSVRQPAGYNRIYGLKPTYGRISRYGLMAYASSTDCVGPLATSEEDIRILLNVMSGYDPKDMTSSDYDPVPESVTKGDGSINGMKIGYYKSFIESDAVDKKTGEQFKAFINSLKEMGAELYELDFMESQLVVSVYYVIAMAETASNLARLDGTTYGKREQGRSLKDGYAVTRSMNFTEESKRRIVGGNQVLSHGYSDAIYIKANKLRSQICDNFKKDFEKVSIIISPVTPSPVPTIGCSLDNPLAMYLSDAYTVGFSLGALPTLSAPYGVESGVQITARHGAESDILEFSSILRRIYNERR